MSLPVENIIIDLYRGQITPWHEKILNEWELSQYKILWAGRKARKTTFDINELVYWASTDERGLTYTFIGPTRTQAKEIVWDDHVAQLVRLFKKKGIIPVINKSDLSVTFPGYGKLTIDGADDIESLRGKSDWGGVVLDEFATWKNKRYAWEEVIEPNLSVHKAWAIVSGTPKGFEYHHRLMKKGDHANVIEGDAFDEEGGLIIPNQNYRAYRFTSYDNPYADKKWIDEKKATMSEAAFNQEYLARATSFTGLIYKEFNRDIHIVPEVEMDGFSVYYRTMDFGAVNPTVCLYIKVDRDDNFWVYDEYYETEKTTDYHAGQILARHPQTYFRATFGDPSGKQEILDYARWGLHISPANKQILDKITGTVKTPGDQDWVNYGIEQVQQRLKISAITKKPRLFISKNCANLIREFESYRWEENKREDLNSKEVPVKANDHALDALRYFIVSYQKPQQKRKVQEQKVSLITGY